MSLFGFVLDDAAHWIAEDLGVAALDQYRAATAESRDLLRTMGRATGRGVGEGGWTPAAIAWSMAVGTAIGARVRFTCPYAREFGVPMPVMTSLTAGARACRRCIDRGSIEWPAALDEDCCDVCANRTRVFREVSVVIGAWAQGRNRPGTADRTRCPGRNPS